MGAACDGAGSNDDEKPGIRKQDAMPAVATVSDAISGKIAGFRTKLLNKPDPVPFAEASAKPASRAPVKSRTGK
jgi:hypothetical protein